MKNYRADIDGLRAIAVLSVIFFHFDPRLLPGGFAGVDIFFVISGYLISTIIFSATPTKPFSYRRFYLNRAKRILPALILTVLVTTAIGFLVLLKDEIAQLGNHLIATASFNSNFQLWREAGYFDAKSETKPLLHLWSLAVEEQFYFIWPTLILVSNRNNKRTFLTLSVCIVLSLCFSLYETKIGDQTQDFYSPFARFWEILAGSFLAYLTLFKPKALQWINGNSANILSFIGISLCVFSVFLLNKNLFFPGYWALVPVVGTVLIIAAGGGAAWINEKFLSHSWMVFVGLISYPLYLWHWPLLSYSQIINNGSAPLAVKTVAIISSFVLAWLTYQYVEKKIRFNRQNEAVTACSLLALMGAVLLLGLATSQNKIKGRLHGPEFDKITEAKYNWNEVNAQHLLTIRGSDGSVLLKGQTEKTVLLLGDSHAAMYWPRFEELYSESKPELSLHFIDRSSSPEGLTEYAKLAAKDPNVVKVALSYYWDFKCFSSIEFEEVLRVLIAAKKKIVMITSNPTGEIYSPTFFVRRIQGRVLNESEAPTRSIADYQAGNQACLEPLVKLAKDFGIEIIDPIDYLCRPDGQCPTVIDGEPIYFDSHHIRPKFAKKMNWLDQLVLQNLYPKP